MTALEKLAAKYNIYIPEKIRIHPYYAAYDWESLAQGLHPNYLTPIPDLADFNLPAEMDPRKPPADAMAEIRKHWKGVCTSYDRNWQDVTVYRPMLADVPKLMTKIAAKQGKSFKMSVKAILLQQTRWTNSIIASSGLITNPQEFETFLGTVTRDYEGEALAPYQVYLIK